MAISSGLALKGGAGLATATAGSLGIYYGVDHLQNRMTKFDRGLIDFLNGGGEIKFAVTDGSSKLSNFPELTADQTIAVVVKTNGGKENIDGSITNGQNAKKGDLKAIIDKDVDHEWAWKCEIKLNKNSGTEGAKELKNKDLLLNDNEDGFLNKLRKEGKDYKDLKVKFIEDCARARGKNKNREINNKIWGSSELNKEIKAEKIFNLRKGDENRTERDSEAKEDPKKLYFENEKEFKEWFLTAKNK